MVIVGLQMLQQMQKDRRGGIAMENMPMRLFSLSRRVEDMAEELLAKILEQKILCLKVRVKGGSSDIRALDDFADGDLMIILFR